MQSWEVSSEQSESAKPNQKNIILKPTEPRTDHKLKGLIEDLSSLSLPDQHQNEIITRLFVTEETPNLINHFSDLEENSEPDIVGGVSTSDFFGLDKSEYSGYTKQKVKSDRSLFRAIAIQVFGNEDFHNNITDEVMKYVKQSLNSRNITKNRIAYLSLIT
jgi:hypothetical protein